MRVGLFPSDACTPLAGALVGALHDLAPDVLGTAADRPDHTTLCVGEGDVRVCLAFEDEAGDGDFVCTGNVDEDARCLLPVLMQRLHSGDAGTAGRLGDFFPLLLATNAARRPLDEVTGCPLADLLVEPGSGQVGDLVVGDVFPGSATVSFFDHNRHHLRVPPGGPLRVVATLGNRESSTHAVGGVPDGGLVVPGGAEWLGKAGLVGVSQGEPCGANTMAEISVPFRVLGLLRNPATGTTLNLRHFVKEDAGEEITTPLVVVTASSAEAGKSTLTHRIIGLIRDQLGLSCASVKATGTGGVGDTAMHAAAGAVASYDQVDAGLPSTYVSADVFKGRILSSLRRAQASGASVIVVELGGDLVWANNPTFLRMPEVAAATAAVVAIANDALAAIGLRWFADSTLPGIADKLHLVASPFRSLEGMRRRSKALSFGPMADPNSDDDFVRILGRVLPTTRRRPILVLQHIDRVPPGHLLDAAAAAGRSLHVVAVNSAAALADVVDACGDWSSPPYCGVASLGGPMSANDDLEWIPVEMELLHTAHAASVPLLGLCLGSQLLARALGGKVVAMPAAECGYVAMEPCADAATDPVLGAVPASAWSSPASFVSFHGDKVEVPPGGAVLATSAATEAQAWRLGATLGIQFHPEAPPRTVQRWSRRARPGFLSGAGTSEEEVVAQAVAMKAASTAAGVALLSAWVATLKD